MRDHSDKPGAGRRRTSPDKFSKRRSRVTGQIPLPGLFLSGLRFHRVLRMIVRYRVWELMLRSINADSSDCP